MRIISAAALTFAIAAFGLGGTPAAAKSIWQELNEAAPRSVFDDLNASAPRSIFDEIRETAPVAAPDADPMSLPDR